MSVERTHIQQFHKNEELNTTLSRRSNISEFLEYVNNEIEDYKNGNLKNLSKLDELAEKFGLTRSGVLLRLKKHGLDTLRKELKLNRTTEQYFIPSTELAWTIGVLATSGSSFPERNDVKFFSKENELLEQYQTTVENIFKQNATRKPRRTFADGKKGETVSFFNKYIPRVLGDLRRKHWHETLISQHKWILEQERYIWAFLSGIFDTKATVNSRSSGKSNEISIYTSNKEAANLISELLTRVGIQNPRIDYINSDKDRPMKVAIGNVRDIKKFAENTKSTISRKDKQLETFRQIAKNLPDSWKTNLALSYKLKSPSSTVKEKANKYRNEHPEWFKNQLRESGFIVEYYSPELITELTERLTDIQKAPSGWKNTNEVRVKLRKDHATIKRYISKYRDKHPEWFRFYHDSTGKKVEYFSPELYSRIRAQVSKIKEPPIGWLNLKQLSRLLKKDPKTVNSRIKQLTDKSGGNVGKFRADNNKLTSFYSPEFVKILKKNLR